MESARRSVAFRRRALRSCRKPDQTHEVAPDVAAQRLALRDTHGTDRIGGRDTAYHARVAQAFATFAETEPQRFARIDGNGTPEETRAGVWDALIPLLPPA